MSVSTTQKPKGYFVWPMIVIGILVATAGLDFLLFYFSRMNSEINIEDASYDKGISFQQNIDQQKRAHDLGITASAEMSASGMPAIVVTSPSSPLPAQINLKAVRPADSRLDFAASLAAANGRFSIEKPIQAGLWLFTITFDTPSGLARIELKSEL